MNTDPLTEAELARVLELDAKATERPWSHYQMTQDRGHFRYLQAESHAVGVINTWPNSEPLADADLIAEYRTLCPRLARELLATREKLKVAREAIEKAPHDGKVCNDARNLVRRSDGIWDAGCCDCWKSAALASIENSSPQTTEKPNHQ